jgi:CheY-like chemotaxis protein
VSGRSDGGQGSTFWFTFPYRPGESRTDDLSALPSISDVFIKPKHILIVDDSPSILKVTARMLEMNGHTVTTASNGSIGLNMMKRAFITQEYDMVLTDIQMPVMDGIEATRRYREFEEAEMELEKSSVDECSSKSRNERGGTHIEKKNSHVYNTGGQDSECIYAALTRSSSYIGKLITNISHIIVDNNDDCDTSSHHPHGSKVANFASSDSYSAGKLVQTKLTIIGMSANSDSLTEQEALDCGMDHFISKPFAYKQLLSIFESLHKNDHSRRSLDI